MRRIPLTLAGLAILVTATACSAGSDSADHSAHEGHETSASSSATSQAASSPASGTPSASQGGHAHGQEHMHAMDGGPAPEGIAAAEKPTYPVGTQVTLTTDHMEGMRDAPATVVGAYKTVAYAVNYTPTDGGPEVTNHKWVVQEELKGVGSERAWVLLGTESLQTYGGSGFLKEYPLEQYVRDAKIDTLYEGTTAIQGLDFFFRKIVKDQGVALGMLQKEIETTIGQAPEALKREAGLLAQAATDLKDMGEFMFGAAMGSLEKPAEAYKIGLTSTRLLLAAGDVVIGWLLLRAAIVAQARLEAGDAGKDTDFYTGKVAAAQFFARTVLPRMASEKAITIAEDGSLMDVPESAF